MSDSLIMSMYEEGRTVKEIAKAIDKGLLEVNHTLAKTDDMQPVQVTRQEKHVRDLRRVRALADGITQVYLENLQETLADPKSTGEQKKAAFGEMDKVIRISKLSSDRVLLAEGKTTENIGVNGGGEVPFNVVFTKTYETPPEAAECRMKNDECRIEESADGG